ncbi:putative basement membrane-specific heparan sulfate proteoglycan core protein-like isoform X2 [Penaeus vannamei]|uniref:Putative basement membrane-specific heparan sulfate proteoglycan core protein-like isoform X2 n=1 Tax=Penaeus vannamei TaxID=6689 RepID=A0A423TQV3_PENVA|nr:putative basement membrane-specific heparan sulfate proteoglycan core protein-like isoform X2 [Penaeus vannamei]
MSGSFALHSQLVLWLLLCCSLDVTVTGSREGQIPVFGKAEKTVTVKEGDTARLPCVVEHLNDKAVTWLRRRDLHILTVGHHTYSADERFQVVHAEASNEWTLVVRYVQRRDAGVYECQINTDHKLSRAVTLKVHDTSQQMSVSKTKVFLANNTASTKDGNLRVEIQGPRELYIEEGSSLSLTCVVTSSRGPSKLIYWYHNTNLIDYNSPRGGVSLKVIA